MSLYDEARERFEQTRSRVDYRLTYERTQPREFHPDMLYGPDLPDAFGEGTASGEWFTDDHPSEDDPEVTEEDWFSHFLHMALGEAVHEVLEWFKVDGRPWLDPHGHHEPDIHHSVRELAAQLAAYRLRTVNRKDDE